MNNETKKEVKKNVATGASTAAGAAAGVVIGAALSPEQANAQEVPNPDSNPRPSSGSKPSPTPEHKPEPAKPETQDESDQKPEPPKPEPVIPDTDDRTDEIEVLGYDRVTNEDGSQMDVAVLNVNGNEVGVVDVNLDGEADAFICDVNQDGIIDDGEVMPVQGEGFAMQPLADAAGFSPMYTHNDLPDYVNDAEVDNYMA